MEALTLQRDEEERRTGINTDIAVSPDGRHLAEVNYGSGVVRLYRLPGLVFERKLIQKSRSTQSQPVCLCFGPDNTLFIGETKGCRVVAMSLAGKRIGTLSSTGNDLLDATAPASLATNGEVVVVFLAALDDMYPEVGRINVLLFDYKTRAFMRSLAVPGGCFLYGSQFGATGQTLLVADARNNLVFEMDLKGIRLRSVSLPSPCSVALGGTGEWIVACQPEHKVCYVDPRVDEAAVREITRPDMQYPVRLAVVGRFTFVLTSYSPTLLVFD